MKGLDNISISNLHKEDKNIFIVYENIKRNNTNIPRNFESFQKKVPLAE